jgi:putative ABC transport system ATP-binding protein
MKQEKITLLEARDVGKTFQTAGRALTVLADVSFALREGDTCAVIGPSGSGKTTLLGLCAGLDRPSTGEIALGGRTLSALNEDEVAVLRNQISGFVFQNFRLIPSLTALENVLVPAELQNASNRKARAMDLLDEVGLAERVHHYPSQLSGGEQQRVAIARAFINQPQVIFADEPTGNLDAATGARVLDLLFDLNKRENTTLLLVTHDMELTRRVQRVIALKNGRVTQDAP